MKEYSCAMSEYREPKKSESEKTMKREKIIHHDIVNHLIELLIKGVELIVEFDDREYGIDCLIMNIKTKINYMKINAVFSLIENSKKYSLTIFYDNSFTIERLIYLAGRSIPCDKSLIATGNMTDLNIYKVSSC